MSVDSILFEHLGLRFSHVGQNISIFGFEIAYYGMVITFGMILAWLFILADAKRKGQSTDDYLDVIIWGMILGVIGARAYYVIFSWSEYKDRLIGIFMLREGGLAIYGGIIGGFIGVCLICKKKGLKLFDVLDSVAYGVLIGQIFGRWGNFFNREAFGGYSDGLLSMQIPVEAVRDSSDITAEMTEHLLNIDGISFVSVHPTFLYESLWNLGVFLLLLYLRKKKVFDGELFFLYLMFYGLGRFWIESLRTDQLKMIGINLPVSQVLSVLLILVSVVYLMYHFLKIRKGSPNVK